MSESLDVPFLTFNAWVGLWVALYLLIGAFVDLNKLMKHATRSRIWLSMTSTITWDFHF
jgi:hypothetical protein